MVQIVNAANAIQTMGEHDPSLTLTPDVQGVTCIHWLLVWDKIFKERQRPLLLDRVIPSPAS